MKSFKTAEEYIKNFPKDIQDILEKLRKIVKELSPEAVESISYGMPGYKLNNKALVYFAAYKNHIGFYPIPSGIEAFRKELEPYIKGKGTLQFPLGKEIPYELIKKVVKFRVKDNSKI